MLGEAGDVDTGATVFTGTVDDAGQCLALLARFAVHGVEAATQAADRVADQVAGTFDFAARALHFVGNEAAQLGEQLVLLTQDAGVLGGSLGLGPGGPPGKAQPAECHRGQDGPAQRGGPFETDGERKKQGQDQGGGQTDEDA